MPSAIPFRPHLLPAAAGLLVAMTAQAQQAAPVKKDAPAPEAAVQRVEVQGKLDSYDPRRDDTASKIVVNHDELVKYGDTSLADALKRVAGVTVGGGGGRGTDIRMRGLGAGYTQILLNGERAPAGFDIGSLAPDVIERIEVLRAASAEYSAQSIAGTMNIVLKKTVKAAQRELKAGYGRGGGGFKSPTLNLQLADKLGKLSYSFAGNFFRSEFTNDPASTERFFDAGGRLTGLRRGVSDQDGRFTGINLTPRLNYTFDNGDTLSAQTFANAGHFRQHEAGRIDTLQGPPPAYPVLDQTARNDNDLFRQEFNWVHGFASGAKLDAKISGLYGSAENITYREGRGNPAAGALNARIQSNNDVRGGTSTGKYTSARFEGHALAFGWDAGYTRSGDARRESDSLRPDLAVPGGDETFEASVARLAVYAQDEWNVTPRWSVYLGARWEGIRTAVEGNTFEAIRNRSSVLSPVAQTLYKLPGGKGDQLRLALSRTYKANSVQTLIPHRFTSVNNSQTDPDTTGNPNLKPELALGIDAAYEHYWADGALLSASVSSRRITDYTRNLVTFDGARWVSAPSNLGSARTYGLELEARFPLKALMQTSTALDLRASLSRNWSSVDAVPGPDNRLANQTPLSATLGADYKKGALTTGASFVFKNGGFARVLSNQTAYTSVRRDLDLYALWKFGPKLQLRVASFFLLAQDTVNESTYFTPGEGSQSSRTVSPSRRGVRATLEMKF